MVLDLISNDTDVAKELYMQILHVEYPNLMFVDFLAGGSDVPRIKHFLGPNVELCLQVLQPDMWGVVPSDRHDWSTLRENIKRYE